ncbi:MAG: glycerol-3-phosphate acyltransferase [Cyanobacteria bacterium Co-bin13]|nr:glycerol-3-phosphate acyltransferase [Cyanobacteria bacterium Co-bin13]
MSLLQVWGALVIFGLCPLLGGLPLTGWITRLVAGRNLANVGTGNVGVSAAFYHGGKLAGVLAVLAEAFKGIAAVLLARYFFPTDPVWEVIALIALVIGRYWIARGAGTTNVTWGFLVHDWRVMLLTFGISSIGFTIFRERRQGRLLVLILLPVLTAVIHSSGERVLAVACLSGLIAWIYQKLPDDLDLSANQGRLESQTMFRFFRGDRALLSLDQPLSAAKVGGKAATLAQLRAWGYPVPLGYVLPAGDDPKPLIEITQPSPTQPVVVRSSALDEDTELASAAGLYTSIVNVTSQPALEVAIQRCFASYNNPGAVKYRRDRNTPDQGLAVLVQTQVQGVFSGVAFSRDPIARCGDAVVIEALPGAASQVVSGQQTPESYQVWIGPDDLGPLESEDAWKIPEALTLTVEGAGEVPARLIQQVAYLARHLEEHYHGIPQDIEWSYDGETLWLLQSRPITTLQPIWTRKIAAEVIPGSIRPLTWSINRPLTCGVWGDIFTIVLGSRAKGLDFEETATLHHSYAYFNATLLGDIFRRMGLPPESLEFLTRGAKFSKPPLASTLRNLPGLLRLLRRELALEKDFEQEFQTLLQPGLEQLAAVAPKALTPPELLERIETVLTLLRRATYYNIFAPLSFAVREGMFKVPSSALNPGQNPEVAALKDLAAIAAETRQLLPATTRASITDAPSLMVALSETPEGQVVLSELDQFIATYGYLSQVGTDIAVPTWQENPGPVRELLAQYVMTPPAAPTPEAPADANGWKQDVVQQRLNLKGQVNAVYSRLLADLRGCFLALESRWLEAGLLSQVGDIFFLTFEEIKILITNPDAIQASLPQRLSARQQQFEADRKLDPVPMLVFGNDPPRVDRATLAVSPLGVAQTLSGIGASPGIVEGEVRVMRELSSLEGADGSIILVVPYTDAGWAPLLARANGLIAEVGGRLSHGAIVAREYGIPAVMDVTAATQRFQNGQRVRIDGAAGTVEVLAE